MYHPTVKIKNFQNTMFSPREEKKKKKQVTVLLFCFVFFFHMENQSFFKNVNENEVAMKGCHTILTFLTLMLIRQKSDLLPE